MIRSFRVWHLLRVAPLLAVPFRGLPTKGQVPVDPAFAVVLQEKLDSCRNVYNVPGISATLLLPGDRFWNGTAGVADINTQAPVLAEHVFQAASVTKLFTATVVFQLIEEGQLDLDDTLGSYLPQLPHVPGDMPVRLLLNHRSGIADFLATPGVANAWFSTPDAVWTGEQVLTTFMQDDPLFAPNTAFSYSNTNYVLLGMLVETITGHSFAEELQARILDPIGLENVHYPPALPISGQLIPGWTSWTTPNTYDTDVTPVLRDCFASMVSTAGAVVARPHDLARFTRAVMRGDLLHPSSLSTMRTCTTVNFGDGATGYGLGTMRYSYGGRTYYGHSGDISGFTQMAVHSVQDSVTLVLSINRNNAPRGPIAGALLGTLHAQLVGMAEVRSAPAFDLYPVPASSEVHVQSEELRAGDVITLTDATGKAVRTDRAVGTYSHTLPLDGLAPGLYHVRWSHADGVAHRALIVQ